jgi:hypothetical protein
MCSCQRCALSIVVGRRSTKKIFKPKVQLVPECNSLVVSIHFGNSTLLAILQGTEITGTTRRIIKCWCVTIQRTLPLNTWVGPEEIVPGQKQRNLLYNHQIAYVVNVETSLPEVCLSQEKSGVVLSYQFLNLYLSSTQNI